MGSSNGTRNDVVGGDYNIYDNSKEKEEYLIVKPEKGGIWDLLRYAVCGDIRSGLKFLDGSASVVSSGEATDHRDNRWVIVLSIIARKIIALFGKPMEYTGYLVDFFLNLLSQNGGDLFALLYNLLRGEVVIPRRGTETFLSSIGHLDGRIDLYKPPRENLDAEMEDFQQQQQKQKIIDSASVPAVGIMGSTDIAAAESRGNRALMDLCIMASKLAYENAKVVQNIVVHHWKMHFVEFYNCWNDFQKEMSTQVFILCDQPKDANLILISFRGTEPFDADDWSTDFDYSWYEIPKVGKVHMGFLEALGLGNRANTLTFQHQLGLGMMKKKNKEAAKFNQYSINNSNNNSAVGLTTRPSSEAPSTDSGGAPEDIPPEMVKLTAYYNVREKLKSLLMEHRKSKFVVTGHSLGGALAILFPVVMVLHEEVEVMQRLLGIYTFGQPRIGNNQLSKFMERHLMYPAPKYFRVVYCNDLVPRLPLDDKAFLYKHFGECLYYDSHYIEQKMREEPNPNFFELKDIVPAHLNAIWELIRSLTMGYTHGPEYEEGWFSMMLRIIGMALPGISAHSPTDYVNSVRLGREGVLQNQMPFL